MSSRKFCLRLAYLLRTHLLTTPYSWGTCDCFTMRMMRQDCKPKPLFCSWSMQSPPCVHTEHAVARAQPIYTGIYILWACTRAYTFVRYVYMCTSTDGLHSTNGHAFLRMVGQTHGIHTRSLKQISLDRILNIPPRGVGAQTRRALLSFAQAPAQCFLHVCVCSVDR